VKPAAFDYVAAGTVEEALSALRDGDAKVLAGGQSLVPLLNMRLARPSLLVDLNRVPGLDGIEVDGAVRIGALARQADVLCSPNACAAVPLLAAALRHVGHPATRSRGTIGGSLAHADPAAELPAVLLALDGEVVAVGDGGERAISADAFVTGPFTTALRSGELLTAVVLPRQEERAFGFAELSRRHGDFALAGAIVLLGPARIVLFGLGGGAERSPDAERALDDGAPAADVADLATRDVDPVEDVHADGAYRRRAAAVLVRRAVEQAAAGA
jgi:aerobic carbon-monoxide dehydrogenase medium subunit